MRKQPKIVKHKILVLCEDSISFNECLKLYLEENSFITQKIDTTTRSKLKIDKDTFILKKANITIEIRRAKQNSNPVMILQEARNEIANYDKIFCEFDYDANKSNCGKRKQEYNEVLSETLPDKIGLINFNLCFENWLLCHFNNSSKIFSCSNDVIKELNIELKKIKNTLEYKKGGITGAIFDILYKKINDAVKNAKDIEKQTNNKLALRFYKFMEYIESL